MKSFIIMLQELQFIPVGGKNNFKEKSFCYPKNFGDSFGAAEETPEENTSRVEKRWERIVHAVLKRERMGTGIFGTVRSSFVIGRDINTILEAADEIKEKSECL